ncbi:hypothetical protein C7999DRAFT_31725, partial [Corynascus novoguineensis]
SHLSNAFTITLNDVLDDKISEQLMFNSSYTRSKIYFRTLEILRIFGDMVRETGRTIRSMDPKYLAQGSIPRHLGSLDFRLVLPEDPFQDKALWENWRILSEFHQGAEERLLKRIAEKRAEINATALREASRSTTMNRYVIVFTIFTVLYLPPSLTSSLFGTPLFEGENQSKTVERFKMSTVIICVITYVLAFSLIWVAGKWDSRESYPRRARSLYHNLHDKSKETWERTRQRDGADDDSTEASNDAADGVRARIESFWVRRRQRSHTSDESAWASSDGSNRTGV